MTKKAQSPNIEIKIGGDQSGNLAVGNENVQSQVTGVPQATEADLAEIRKLFEELRQKIEAEAPADKKAAALERAGELEKAITIEKKPDLTTMEYVKNWFTKNLPGLAGAITSIVINPFVGVFKAMGGTVASQVWPPADTSDFAPFLTTLEPADALVAWMPGAAVGLFIQYVKMGIINDLPIVGPFHGATYDPWVYAAIHENNPDVAQAMAGVPCAMEYSPDNPSEANQTFLTAAKAAWGDVAISGDLVNSYNAAQLFIKAVQENGGVTTPKELVASLLATEWEGPQGKAFFAEGDRAATIDVYVVAEQPTAPGTPYPYQYVTLKTYEAVPPSGFAPAGGTTDTTAAAETGIFFTDQGGGKVLIEVVPGPGMKFPVSTEGGFAQKIEAFDAAGKSLGLVELPEAAGGVLDYSGIAGIAKLIVTDVPHGNVEYEYEIPGAGGAAETGIFFEDLGGDKVHIVTRPGPGMQFDISTEGGFAVKVEAFDAAGKSLGLQEVPEAAAGVLDYSGIAGIAKIVVTDVPHGNVEYEYMIP
jgi:hypothetical protein